MDWNFGRFDSPLARCFRKDASYEHENEVRAVILRPTHHHAKRVSSDPFTLLDGKLGIEVSFDPARFLDEVVIGPRETHAIAELVKKLLVKYGLKIKVTVSDRLKPRL